MCGRGEVCPEVREDFTRDYGRLRHALQTYQTHGRAYDGTGCLVGPEGALPMEVGIVETAGGEVDAINAKGKDKGKGKVGPCFKCNQMGHVKANCRVATQLRCERCGKVGQKGSDCRGGRGVKTVGGRQQQQQSGRPGGKGAGKGGGAGAPKAKFQGSSWKCGTQGHRAMDCCKVLAIEGEEDQMPGVITPMEPWLLNIDQDEQLSQEMLLIDLGLHACVPADVCRAFADRARPRSDGGDGR